MSKQIKNSQLENPPIPKTSELSKLADGVLYSPTPAHLKLKSRFWTRFQPGPMSNPSDLSADAVMAITNDNRIAKLWSQPGFKDWFLNRDENREKLEYLFSIALDAAEELITNPEANPSAKVNMIKVISELANKFPSRYQQERFTDDEINRMSELQLRTWLEKRGVLVTPLKPLELGEVAYVEPSPQAQDTDAKEDSSDGEGIRRKLRGES